MTRWAGKGVARFARCNGTGSGGDADESKSNDATESSELDKSVS